MKIGIAYASLSGNTSKIALEIKKYLDTISSVQVFDMLGLKADTLLGHDIVFMGSSTYDEGLNAIAQIFFDMAKSDNHQCLHAQFALFALGDSTYPYFATSGALMKSELEGMGAHVLEPVYIIDSATLRRDAVGLTDWISTILDTVRSKRST